MVHIVFFITMGLAMTSREGLCGMINPDQSNIGNTIPGGPPLCPDGYNLIAREARTNRVTYCFKLYTVELNRTAAWRRCHRDYAELVQLDILKPSVVIPSLTQYYEDLMSILNGRRVWVGLKKQGGRLVWDRASPSPANSSKSDGLIRWKKGHPSLSGDCVKGMLQNKPTVHVRLMMADCEEKLPFFCYSRPVQVKLTAEAPYCTKGWHGNELLDKCYYYPRGVKETFDLAVKTCNVLGGRLAMPTGSFTNSLIRHMAVTQYTDIGAGQDGSATYCPTCSMVTDRAYCKPARCRSPDSYCFINATSTFPKEYVYTMGCTSEEICSKFKNLHRDSCYRMSGQLPSVCYQCCYGSMCTNAGTLLPEQAPPVWLGIKQTKRRYVFLNGKKVNETFFFPAGVSGNGRCVIMDTNVAPKNWKGETCTAKRNFICEMDADIPEPVRLTTVSRKYIEVDETDIQDQFLVCKAKNYYPEMPIVWYKDDVPLWAQSDAAGFRLNLADIRKREPHVSFVQGTYHCTARGRHLLTQVTSHPISVRIRGLFTLRGRLHLPGITDKQRHVADWLLWGRLSRVYYTMVHSMVKIASENFFRDYVHNITWSVEGHPSWQGVVVEFTVNYLEKDIFKVLLSYVYQRQTFRQKRFDRKRINAGTRLPADMYSQKILLQSVLLDHMESTRFGNELFGQYGVQAHDLELYNTEFCLERSIHTKKYGLLKFPSTPAGQIGKTLLNCFSTGVPYGSAVCVADYYKGARWGPVTWIPDCPEIESSSSTVKLKVLAETNVSAANVGRVASAAENLTEAVGSLTSMDVVLTSLILKNIAKVSKIDRAAVKASVRTVNNLMKVAQRELRVAQRTNRAASRTVKSVETIVNHLDLAQSEFWRSVQPNIAVETRKLSQSTHFIGFGTSNVNVNFQDDNIQSYQNESEVDFSAIDIVILLPINSIQKHLKNQRMPTPDSNTRVSYTVYNDISLFTSKDDDDVIMDAPMHGKLASHVISGSVDGLPVYNLSQPVSIGFRPLYNASGYKCVFWDFTMNDDYGGWSDKGCHFHKRQEGSIICRCDHLTNFAILFDLDRSKTTSTALHVLSIIGLSLSLLGLLMTILTFIIFKQFRKGRGFRILFQLAVALFCTDLLVLAGLERTEILGVCSAVAALLLYFLLAAFCWMVVEAVHQYLLFVKVYGSDVSGFMWKAALFAWGIPAVIVSVVAGVDYNMFRGPENYCWINQTALLYAFMIPIGLVIIVNSVLFSMVLRGIFCTRVQKAHRGKGGSHDNMSLQIMVAVACFLVIGLTWVFGFFAIEDAREPFLYLFCIFNSIQGFLIFIFYIVRERRIRAAWVACLCCRRVDGKKDTSATTGNENAYTRKSKDISSAMTSRTSV